MSNAISFSARQYYFAKNYPEALNCINKLTEADLMSEDDYLVAARLTRLTGNTYESNLKALEYLEKSVGNAGGNDLMDIQAEYGLIYLRLGKPEEARVSFEKYKRSLESLPDNSKNIEEIKWAESMIRKCQLF
ncbi:MAG: hypothetical protein HC830_09065 [Bacteroidetes bacterium]|nr:hypothetical protein [Bacteroidota bacterium]